MKSNSNVDKLTSIRVNKSVETELQSASWSIRIYNPLNIVRMCKIKQLVYLLTFLLVNFLTCTSCVNEEEFDDNANGNFEALWKIIDQHYCFFDYKQIDWNAIYAKYKPQVAGQLTEDQLFEVLGNMLGELKDGHVNLYSSFDISRYWTWHEAYPSNCADTLFNKYLGTGYRITSGMKYRILDDNVGYIRLESFNYGIGSGNLDNILFYLAPCRKLIIDIRDNGGGMLTSAEEMAARFTNEERLVGYMRHKTGTGHNDFSDMKPQYLKPSKGIRWQKQVCVLTNRAVYSAANEFVKYMRQCPNVTIIGDRTGGGAGMPFSSELPNGWTIRFSACPMYDADKQSTEFGIDPDINVQLSETDLAKGIDTIIEAARK